MPNVFRVPDPLWCMIEIRVLSFNVGERVMPDNMLMVPYIGCIKHKADVHRHCIDSRTFTESEVTSIMKDVDCENPKRQRESE